RAGSRSRISKSCINSFITRPAISAASLPRTSAWSRRWRPLSGRVDMCANKWIIALLGVLLLAGCRSIPEAPWGSVPKRRFIPNDAYGGWATVFAPEEKSGELIAVGPDSVYILDELELTVFALSDIQRAEVFYFRTSQEGFVATTVMAAVFSLIHGPLSLVTFPLAITTGIITTSSEG